jgi:hypothetical protein
MSDNASSAMDGGFGKFVPGFEFLQSLVGQGGSASPPLSSLGSWVAPTFNVEDLEKRIEELKAVQFWLDQNAKALAATIQALEVQKMTLSTLKTMNLSMGDVAQSLGAMVGLGAATESAPAPTHTVFAGLEIPPRTYGNPSAAPAASAEQDEPPAGGADGGSQDGSQASAASAAVDPMQWWGALTQQFQQIATTALQDASRQMVPGPETDTPAAPKRRTAARQGPGKAAVKAGAKTPARTAPAAPRPAAQKVSARQPVRAPASRARAGSGSRAADDWSMPTAFFQMPGFPGMGEAAQKPAASRKAAGASAASGRASAPTAKKKPPAQKKAVPASRRR